MEDRSRTKSRRSLVLWGGLALAVVIGGAAIVHASVPHAFVTNETLTADNLNGNFSALDTRITSLETAGSTVGSVLEMASDINQTGSLSSDLVYASVSVTLTPGTWLVEGFASLSANVPEAMSLGLYDATNSADILNARSGITVATTANFPVALHTSKVIAVTAATTIQLKGFRNGASIISFGYTSVLAGGRNRIMAVRLK
jgi:hypothetical protein